MTEQYIKNKYFKENKRTYLQKSREAFISIYFSLFPKGSLSRSMWRYPQGEGLEKKVHDYEKLGIFIHNKNIILNNYLNDLYLANNIY
ncbi:hypothetical protein HOG21_01090 [bacterium]|nr:hypothetical protein [bacterium]